MTERHDFVIAAPPGEPVGYSHLLHPDWSHVGDGATSGLQAADWTILNRQRGIYYAEQQAEQALRLLRTMQHDATFGYPINTYGHCLQSATLLLRDGFDEETVVVALFHDIGFVVCPTSHGEFAAALLGPYISEQHHWMLAHHGDFQNQHCHDYPGEIDRHTHERWRGHPHFAWTTEFVARYDQNAMRADYDNAPLEFFVPMVQRLFARPPHPLWRD